MNKAIAARRLVERIEVLGDFDFVDNAGPAYVHMGAVLADTVLQPGLNYQFVVMPRVIRIIRMFAEADTLPAFADLIENVGAKMLLQWKHDEKPRRLEFLTSFLIAQGLESCEDLRSWICTRENQKAILSVRGIGTKSVDYLCGLLGLDTVAVDRHLLAFVSEAGLPVEDHKFVNECVCYAADFLGVRRRSLDYSIWCYQRRESSSI